jgi:hypothetical protein
MKPVLEFIVEELKAPFKPYQRPFSELDYQYLFFHMTNTLPFQYQVGSMIPSQITKVMPEKLAVKLACGIETFIFDYDINDKESKLDLMKEFYEGQTIIGRIKSIKFENLKTDFSGNVKIDLTLKSTVLNNHKEYLLKLHPFMDKYNILGNLMSFID